MVLVDTSVWIRFLMNRDPWATELERLLSIGQVAGHELVFGELLIGNSGRRHALLEAYVLMQRAFSVPHNEVATFVRTRSLAARGAGWIDIHLLASAVVAGMQLWTADLAVADIARELHISYIVPAA